MKSIIYSETEKDFEGFHFRTVRMTHNLQVLHKCVEHSCVTCRRQSSEMSSLCCVGVTGSSIVASVGGHFAVSSTNSEIFVAVEC